MRSIHSSLFLIALAIVFAACDKQEPAQEHDHDHEQEEAPVTEVTLPQAAIESNGVRIETVARHRLLPTFRAPARIAFNPEGIAHVGSPVRGRISSWTVKLGDEVKKDDVLMVIESPELGEAQSDYSVKHAAVLASAPQVDLAQDAHARARALHDQTQGIALAEVQKRESELVSARAALAAARAAEQAAANKLILLGSTPQALERLISTGEIDPHVSVRAPIAGQVIERAAALGELVGPERDALLVLADTSSLSVSADVPEARLRDVVVGARARVLLGVEQDHWCEGAVTFISPALDSATRSVRVRIEVDDRHPELRPGVFARAEIEIPAPEGSADPHVVAVPENAVHTIDGLTVVFVPVAGHAGTFEKREVKIGARVNAMIPILSGLAEGEPYVAAGSFVLKAEFSRAHVAHAH